MEFITYLLNDVVFVLLEGVTLLYMYLYIIDRLDFIRTDIGKTLLYIAIFFFIGNYIVAFESLPRTLIFMVLCTLVLAYLTKTNIYLSAITNIISFLIYGVTEMVVSIIVLYFMDVPFSVAHSDVNLKMKALIFVRPIQVVLIYFITKFRFSAKYLQVKIFRKDNSSSALILIILLFMSLFYTRVTLFIESVKELLSSMFIFSIVILFGVIDTKERMKLLDLENQLNLQKEYSKSMELVIDAVRKEKHDYQNHISTLVALCTLNDPEAISRVRSYATRLTENVNANSSFRFYNTGNKYLDGLLAVKNNDAVKKGIIFEVDTEMTLENIDVDDVDLTTIVGNIIDNAFDAVSLKEEEEKKIVSFALFEEDGKCCVSVSNNGPKIPDTHKDHIFDYKYSTKSKAAGERGYGLFIVQELITRNKGEIVFESTEYETEFRMLFRYKKTPTIASVDHAPPSMT